MRVGLTTEGTYPFAKGGVSTWVHQVVTGLPEVEFTVTALTGGAAGAAQYDLPANVTRVDRLSVWGRAPRARFTRRVTVSGFAEAWETILRAGLTPGVVGPADALAAWTRLTEPDTSRRIHTLVTSRHSVDLLAMAYRRARGEAISVRDATLSAYYLARAWRARRGQWRAGGFVTDLTRGGAVDHPDGRGVALPAGVTIEAVR